MKLFNITIASHLSRRCNSRGEYGVHGGRAKRATDVKERKKKTEEGRTYRYEEGDNRRRGSAR